MRLTTVLLVGAAVVLLVPSVRDELAFQLRRLSGGHTGDAAGQAEVAAILDCDAGGGAFDPDSGQCLTGPVGGGAP